MQDTNILMNTEERSVKQTHAVVASHSAVRRKMFLGTYSVKQRNEQGEIETVTYNIPDEIY